MLLRQRLRRNRALQAASLPNPPQQTPGTSPGAPAASLGRPEYQNAALAPGFRGINGALAGRSATTQRITLPAHSPPRKPGCKRLMWFTAVSGREGDIPHRFATFMMPALLSALANAPSLVPNLIYDGPRNLPILNWWTSMGGAIHHHNLSIYHELRAASKPPHHTPNFYTVSGAFLRFDIPLILRNFTFPPDVDPTHVLYTDVDSLFLKDVDSCTLPPTRIFSMGPEAAKGVGEVRNAGVMYINLQGFARHREGFLAYGRQHNWPMVQPILLGYFQNLAKSESESESDGIGGMEDRFNWKAYWGENKDAVILHFHGPKPGVCAECYLLHTADIEYCAGKYHHCRVYEPLWQMCPDGGTFFLRVLQQFYGYVGMATAIMV